VSCVAVTLVEYVFSGLENMLDVQVCAPTPSCFVGDETLVEFTGVSMVAKEFARGGAERVIGGDFWGVDVGEFES